MTRPLGQWHFVFLALVLIGAPMSGAQLDGAAVQGVVRDESDAPVAGASVTITSTRQQARTTRTDANGFYTFTGLQPGAYELLVVLPGFAPAKERIDLAPNTRAGLNVRMRVAIEQRVEVVSSLEEFRRATGLSPVGMTIGPEQLGLLPNDPEIMLLVLRELSATSGRADQVTVHVDGQPVHSRLPPKEAIQSIRISTNSFASEFAEPSAGLVEIVTKPASARYRGETQITFNDSALNAQNFFEPQKGPSRTQGYSGYLGGPIVPSRWSFLAYGGRWMRDERLIVNATTIDPVSFDIRPFVESVETPSRIESYSLRTDASVSPAHLFSAEYARVAESYRNSGLESGLDLPERAIGRDVEEETARAALVSVLGSRVSNEVRMQTRSRALREAAQTTTPAVLVLDTFNGGGNQGALGLDRTTREVSLAQVFSYAGDRHTVRSGVNANIARLEEQRQTNLAGTFIFGADVDSSGTLRATPLERYQRTLQGIRGYGPSTFTIARGAPAVDLADWHLSWFAQDDIRPSPRVTISVGVRQDVQRQSQKRWLDLAPRAGVAWNPDGRGRHVIRGAAGLFYTRIPTELALDALRYDGLGVVELVVDRPAFFPDIPAALDATIALPTVRLIGEVRAPVTTAATASYEFQASKSIVGSISYTHRGGERLLRSRNVNASDPLTGLPPRQDRGPMLQFESTGRSNTQQLRFTLRRALTGVSLFGTYALGWADSDTDGPYTIPADSHTLAAEYGRAGDDQRHSLVVGSVLTFPREWSLSSLMTIGSGKPFNITTGVDDNRDLLFLDRPGLATDGAPGVTVTPFGSFDLTRVAGQSMIARNSGQGPSQFTLNLGLTKMVRLARAQPGDGPYLIVGISAENITNRTNFTDFNGVVTSPLFGLANRALNPRRVELAARVGF